VIGSWKAGLREYSMAARSIRYVCRAVPGQGWRVWDRKRKKWWGNFFAEFPEQLLAELNGDKTPNSVTKLSRSSRPARSEKKR
jgi:hypothetical protein